jgi:hypothetical protein
MSVEAVISTQVIDTTSVGRSIMTAADAAAARTAADAQVTLVSGTNIKTVNSTSLLGSGDITVGLSGTGSVDNAALRADGTGGATLQTSAFVIADNATASPNNTVNHASIQATGGTTNVSVSVKPKGAGAFMLSAPDGTTTGGNVRGDNAIDLQTYFAGATQVASGTRSVAIGSRNTSSTTETTAVGALNAATGTRSSCFGYGNTASAPRSSAAGHFSTASGNYSSSIGYSNTASGQYSSAVGRGNSASSSNASAFGNNCVASALKASAFGYRAKTSVADTTEVGFWSNSTTRGAAVRVHGATGMASMSIQNRATAYTDGGATAGAEADNTLGREMISLRRNGDVLLLDVNVAGTVKTLSLGTAT